MPIYGSTTKTANWRRWVYDKLGGQVVYKWQFVERLDISSGTSSPELTAGLPTGTEAIRCFFHNLNLVSSSADVEVQVEEASSGYATTGYTQTAIRYNYSSSSSQSTASNAFHLRRAATGDDLTGVGELWKSEVSGTERWTWSFSSLRTSATAQSMGYGHFDTTEGLVNFRVSPNGQTWNGGFVDVWVYAPVTVA